MPKSSSSAGAPGVGRCSDATTDAFEAGLAAGQALARMEGLASVRGLFERARDQLTVRELEFIENDTMERARNFAFEARDLCTGLACLVAEDGREGAANTGCFQTPASMHSLLSHLAGRFGAILDNLETSIDAWATLRARREGQQ